MPSTGRAPAHDAERISVADWLRATIPTRSEDALPFRGIRAALLARDDALRLVRLDDSALRKLLREMEGRGEVKARQTRPHYKGRLETRWWRAW